jgi:hypothetical protein
MPALKSTYTGPVAVPDMHEIDKLIEHSIALRDRIKGIEDDCKLKIEKFQLTKNKVDGLLMQFLEITGQTLARTAQGTISISTKHTASLADADIFMKYVMLHGLFELLERRANAAACRDHAEETGKLPPGVNINSHTYLRVRRANEQ